MSLAPVIGLISKVLRGIWAGLKRHPVLVASAVPVVLIVWAVQFVASFAPLTPSISEVRNTRLVDEPAVLLSADGKQLAVFRRGNREWVKLADISPNVIAALIATEDHRFFQHHGVDPMRTIAAAFHTARGELQGGSTITQQLARNLYPDEIGRAPTLARKIKEAITAVKIEQVYDKTRILEAYLNTVPFLYNTYGIEMAARTYFHKSAGELDVLESATLIGMLKGTRYYNPVLNPQRAIERRNIVLASMVSDQRLAPATFEDLKKKPLGLDFELQADPVGPAPHVAQRLRRWLIEWADRNGYDMYADGLVVHTTIDSRLQEMANDAVWRQAGKLQATADASWGRARSAEKKELIRMFLRETREYRRALDSGLGDEQALKKLQANAALVNSLWEEKTRLQSGFVAIDPGNGHVLAWVGSRDFQQEQFDHVEQSRRQPGSTFKPFVYGAAFEQGITPAESFVDQPVEIPVDNGFWRPSDVDAPSGQVMTLREGLVHSKNTITVQLMQQIGPARVAKVAYDMGVRQSKLDQVPSLALGTSPVTLKEMVAGFASIANSGDYIEPMLVTRIEDRHHRVLQDFQPGPPQLGLSSVAAQTLLDVMRGVVDEGTGVAIRRRFGIKADVAGKTGTTQENTDGWFILMHRQVVAGAWVGFNDNRVTMRGNWGQGAHNALNIVGDFFQQSFKSAVIDPKQRFAAPRQKWLPGTLVGQANDLLGGTVQNLPQAQWIPQASLPEPAMVGADPLSARIFEAPHAAEASRRAIPDTTASPPAVPPETLAPPRPARRIDSLPRIVIAPAGQPWAQEGGINGN